MKCKWCRKGELNPVAWVPTPEEREKYRGGPPPGSIRRLGLSEISGKEWTVLRCDKCGHTEWFLNKP